MTRSRRNSSAQENAVVVKRYLVDKIPVSDLRDELGLQEHVQPKKELGEVAISRSAA